MTRLWTIGYERLLPEALVAELRAAGVRRVLDVRFRPQSRRPGMSKTRLGALLGEHGIAYETRRGLGTPPDLRFLYRAGRLAEATDGFRRHLDAAAGDELDALRRSSPARRRPRCCAWRPIRPTATGAWWPRRSRAGGATSRSSTCSQAAGERRDEPLE